MEHRDLGERWRFWLLALLWLPVGMAATAVFRLAPGVGGREPVMWLPMLLMSVPSLAVVTSLWAAPRIGVPAAVAAELPAGGLGDRHRAWHAHGGGIAGGGAARPHRDPRLRRGPQPPGMGRVLVARTAQREDGRRPRTLI